MSRTANSGCGAKTRRKVSLRLALCLEVLPPLARNGRFWSIDGVIVDWAGHPEREVAIPRIGAPPPRRPSQRRASGVSQQVDAMRSITVTERASRNRLWCFAVT